MQARRTGRWILYLLGLWLTFADLAQARAQTTRAAPAAPRMERDQADGELFGARY